MYMRTPVYDPVTAGFVVKDHNHSTLESVVYDAESNCQAKFRFFTILSLFLVV